MRARAGVIAAAVGCIAVTLVAPGSAAAKVHNIKISRQLRTDGLLTVGGEETAVAKGMPARTYLFVMIDPLSGQNSCFNLAPGTCLPTPVYPAAGAPGFRTSASGRAVLTFVMPSSYLFTSGFPEPGTYQRPFPSGQKVYLRAIGTKEHLRGGARTVIRGHAVGSGVVEVPPAPSL